MMTFRRFAPLVAALVAITLVASPADAKKKKPPAAQQGIAGSVTILVGFPIRAVAAVNEASFEFDWSDADNASAEIEATFATGPGEGFNDVDIFVQDASGTEVAAVAGADCNTAPGSGCSTENGHELKALAEAPCGNLHGHLPGIPFRRGELPRGLHDHVLQRGEEAGAGTRVAGRINALVTLNREVFVTLGA